MADDVYAGIRLAEDGTWAEFRTRLPHRGMGLFLMACSLLGLLIVAVAAMMLRGGESRREAGLILAFGILITAAFLLPGLCLLTRWRGIRLTRDEVRCQRGWLLRRSVEVRPMDEFAGLALDTRPVETGNLWHAIRGIGLAALDAFVHVGEQVGRGNPDAVPMHFLSLAHRHRRGRGVVLAVSRDPAVMAQLRDDLAQAFGIEPAEPQQGAEAGPPVRQSRAWWPTP